MYYANKELLLKIVPEFEDRLEFLIYENMNIPRVQDILNSAPSGSSIAVLMDFIKTGDGKYLTMQESNSIISEIV